MAIESNLLSAVSALETSTTGAFAPITIPAILPFAR
jgi:hypothetical protein